MSCNVQAKSFKSAMDFNDFDISKMKHAINESHQQMAEVAKAKAEYQAELESATFETLDLLRQMQEDSAKESRFNRCTTYILIVIAILTLFATIVFGLDFLWH